MSEHARIDVLDERQLIRIEATHRGFLYQHLYAANCLLLAGRSGVSRVVTEGDEDVELSLGGRRIYVQVKTRKDTLSEDDVGDVLARFAELRSQHEAGAREGEARFVVASNVRPSRKLIKLLAAQSWPADVGVHWPGGPSPGEACLPEPCGDVVQAVAAGGAHAAAQPVARGRPGRGGGRRARPSRCGAGRTASQGC